MPTYATPGPVDLHLDVTVGDVRIVATDRTDSVVDVRPSDPASDDDASYASQTRVGFAEGRLTVKAPKHRWRIGSRVGGSADLTIEVPSGSTLTGVGGMTDVASTGRLGDCRVRTGLGRIAIEEAATLELKSGAGDLIVGRATGSVELSSGSGEIRLTAADLGAVVKNTNGATWVGTAGGPLRINAANGAIAVDLAAGDATAKAANGPIRVSEVVRGTVVLESQMGDIEVGIREGTAAWVDASASAGRVRNTLEPVDAPTAPTDRVDVRARTTIGEIVIRRP